MNTKRLVNFAVRKWWVVPVAVMVTIIWNILSSFSYISVTVGNASPSENAYTYRFLNQDSQKVASSVGRPNKVTKLVHGKKFEINVSTDRKNAFGVVTTRGFFRKSDVNLSVASEKSREFVGNVPQACMFYPSGTLYSYPCAGTASITTHTPATASVPTITSKRDTPMGIISSNIITKEGAILFGKQPNSELGAVYPYTANLLGSNGLVPVKSASLTSLQKSVDYYFSPYKDGFIAANLVLSKLYYYSSISAKPELIDIGAPKGKDLTQDIVSSYGDSIIAVYSDRTKQEVKTAEGDSVNTGEGARTKKALKINTQVLVYKNGKTKQFGFNDTINSIIGCGNDKLCILKPVNNGTVFVYDISGKEAKPIYQVSNAKSIYSFGDKLLIVRTTGIIALDANKQSGLLEFSITNSRICGINGTADGFLLCLTNSRSENVVLHVNESVDDKGSIDKKVDLLRSIPSVTTISAYKNYIFVPLRLPTDYYDSGLHTFSYDPVLKKKAVDAVNAKVKELGIDTNAYNIITLPR